MSLVTPDDQITLALTVTDRHASAIWYEEKLGFKLRFHGDEMGWSEMSTNTPGVVLGFGEHTKPEPGNCVPVFGVSDLDAARETLAAAGVNFDGETQVIDGMVKLATLYDPDNNALMLAERLSGR